MDKKIDMKKTVYELCSDNPHIAEVLAEAGFTDITKKGMLNTAGRFMTIPKGAKMKKIKMEEINQVFAHHGYTTFNI